MKILSILSLIVCLSSCTVHLGQVYRFEGNASVSEIVFSRDSSFTYKWLSEFPIRDFRNGETHGTWSKQGNMLILNSTNQPQSPGFVQITDTATNKDSMEIIITYKDTFGFGICSIVYPPINNDPFSFIIAAESGEIRYGDTLKIRILKPSNPINFINFYDYYALPSFSPEPLIPETYQYNAGEIPNGFSVVLTDQRCRYFTESIIKVRRNSIRLKE